MCYTELIVEDLPHIATIWTLWQRALSTISFVTVAIVHTALIIIIIINEFHRDASLKQNFRAAESLNHLYTAKLKPPGAMRLRARGHDFELPTVKFEFNKRSFIVRSLFQ